MKNEDVSKLTDHVKPAEFSGAIQVPQSSDDGGEWHVPDIDHRNPQIKLQEIRKARSIRKNEDWIPTSQNLSGASLVSAAEFVGAMPVRKDVMVLPEDTFEDLKIPTWELEVNHGAVQKRTYKLVDRAEIKRKIQMERENDVEVFKCIIPGGQTESFRSSAANQASTETGSNEPLPVGEAGALYAFMGWLTSRKEVSGPFGASQDTSPAAAQLVNTFCQSQEWEIGPENQDWYKKLKPYPKAKAQAVSDKDSDTVQWPRSHYGHLSEADGDPIVPIKVVKIGSKHRPVTEDEIDAVQKELESVAYDAMATWGLRGVNVGVPKPVFLDHALITLNITKPTECIVVDETCESPSFYKPFTTPSSFTAPEHSHTPVTWKAF